MLKMLIRRTLVSVSVLLLSAGIAQAAPPIKIGTFLSVTGPASFLGDPELKTLQIYVKKINEAGGVLGRKLELVHYDTSGKAGAARTFVKRLIDQDHVDVIVGGSTTGDTMAVIPLVERARVPLISLAGGIGIVEPVKKWVFKTPHTDRMAAEKVFADMKARGITRIGLMSGTGGFGRSGRKESLAVAPKDHLGLDLSAFRMLEIRNGDWTLAD